jgi:hypothetical protein
VNIVSREGNLEPSRASCESEEHDARNEVRAEFLVAWPRSERYGVTDEMIQSTESTEVKSFGSSG